MNCRHCMAQSPCHRDRSGIPLHHGLHIFHDCIRLLIHLIRLTRLVNVDYSLVLLGSFELGTPCWRRFLRMQRLVCHILISAPSAWALKSFHFSTKLLYHSVHSGYRIDKREKLRLKRLHLHRRRTALDLHRVRPSEYMVYSSDRTAVLVLWHLGP